MKQATQPTTKRLIRLMIVAGEPSGYTLAVNLIQALRRTAFETAPEIELEFFGATGAPLRACGVESVVAMDDLARVGIVEIGKALPQFWQAFKALQRAAEARQPDAVILIDYPEFNLRLARALHKQGRRVIFYVSPQLWAWRSGRVRAIRDSVDLLLTILPFEAAWYKERNVTHTRFIGHPLVGEVAASHTREDFCREYNLDARQPIIALLPGSRRQELKRHLPILLEAAALLLADKACAQFVVALAPHRRLDEIAQILNAAFKSHTQLETHTRIAHAATYNALAAADCAAVTSGTATLEAALIGAPHVIVYCESSLNWHTIGRFIEIDTFGLPNLIAGKRIVTELIQHDFTPARVARELLHLLSPARNQEARRELGDAIARLGASGASTRAAYAILEQLKRWREK